MRVLVAGLALLAPLLAGCLTASNEPALDGIPAATAGLPFPPEEAFAVLDAEGKPLPWSEPVQKGALTILPGKVVDVPSFDGVKLNVGIFLPEVPEGTKLPALVDVGPYYGELDDPVGTPAHVRLGKFLIDNFVPHGYVVVQASVRGTGASGGCNDYLGATETRDIDVLLTWLGEQPWSNGAIGVIGKSYDGTTAWQAATTGNPYLKTIVPISGIDSMQQLHFRNGSAEFRSLSLGSIYYSYGATQGGPNLQDPAATQPDDPQQATRSACPSPFSGAFHAPEGAFGYLTGGGSTGTDADQGPQSQYWRDRDYRARALANYKGSLFHVHGFQDWNVKPSQGLDIYNQFPGPKKALVGQWAHHHPDRASEHPNARMDWAEMLLRWFDQELKGASTDTGPAVLVEDTHGNWRAEPANAFPPLDAEWIPLHPTQEGKLVAEGAKGEDVLYAPYAADDLPLPGDAPVRTILAFETEPFAAETRVSGTPRFHVTVEPQTSGGQLWAELHEVLANGSTLWIGRAQMDLRYAAGGETPAQVVPGEPIVARMEFYPLDARILAGSKLKLILTQELAGSDVLPSAQTGPVKVVYGDEASTLLLPIVERPFVPTRWDTDLWLPALVGRGGA